MYNIPNEIIENGGTIMQKTFLAGAARRDITPKVGTLLYGYNPHQVSTSVHDPLNVTAVAFSDDTETVILLTVTVGDFQTALCDEIREKIGKLCGIPCENVVISATHTHSAPNVAGFEGWGDVDRAYVDEILLPAMLEVSREATASVKPAVVGIGSCNSDVGINRRQHNRNGGISLGQNPWGCYDPVMTVISVRATDGTGIINMIHYGCHGTAAGCNHEISRDWSGIMCDRLESVTGTLTAYWNGAQGDVGPRLTNGQTTGDIRYVEELGGVAAQDALRAYRAVGSYHNVELEIKKGTVRLPYRDLPDLMEVRRRLAEYENPDTLINIDRLKYSHLRDVEAALSNEGENHPTHFTFPQTVVAIGDVAVVPFPYEMFSAITRRLAAYSPYRHTLGLSNTNGYNAYLPSEDQICLGGYEVECFVSGAVYTLTDNADQYIIEENLRIMESE